MIRKAELKDLDGIYALYTERYNSNDAASIRYKKSDWKWYLKNDRAIIFVLESNKRILGMTFSYDMGLWGYMEHVVIKKAHRKKGYARALIKHTMDHGMRLGWRLLEACYYAEIATMRDFFQRLGWRDSGINTRWVYVEKPKLTKEQRQKVKNIRALIRDPHNFVLPEEDYKRMILRNSGKLKGIRADELDMDE